MNPVNRSTRGHQPSRRSLLAVGIHKAGSVALERVLGRLAPAAGLRYRPLSRGIMRSRLTLEERLARDSSRIEPFGDCYGVVRSPHFVALAGRLDELDLIAQIRDPRDCLTSNYFSIAFSHSVPRARAKRRSFLERRALAQRTPIDDWVLGEADRFRRRFEAVASLAAGRHDMPVLRYEDMVVDSEMWLLRLCGALGVELSTAERAAILDDAGFGPVREDVSRHKRQVEPGDHRRKLRAETIAQLNITLAAVMDHFGYDRDHR